MMKKFLILIALLIVVALMLGIAYKRATTRDSNLQLLPTDSCTIQIPAEFRNRTLVWTTNANVPLRLVGGQGGHDLFDLVGLPPGLLPDGPNVGREPVSDEWNVAMLEIGDGNTLPEVKYLTENTGSYRGTRISADGRYVVASMESGDGGRDIVRFDLARKDSEIVSFTHSVEQWPSISGDGKSILFHSFRNNTPQGDLFLAIENDETESGWDTFQLTENPDVQFVWPMMNADADVIVAAGWAPGERTGKITIMGLYGTELSYTEYLTDNEGYYVYPSVNSDGSLVCWGELDDNMKVINLYDIQAGTSVQFHPDEDYSGLGWDIPSISSDGSVIVFLDDYPEVDADRIGVLTVETGDINWLTGCGGNIMFPMLSDTVSE